MQFVPRWAVILFAALATAIAAAQSVTKLTVSPATVVGGASTTGTVTLSKKAGASGVNVQLLWFYDGATTPPSVTVPSGSATATFTVSTSPVESITKADIEARIGKIGKTATLTLEPPTLASLTLGVTSTTGVSFITGTVTLGSAAPRDSTPVSLSSSSVSASVPSTVYIAAGGTSARFLISTRSVDTITLVKVVAKLGTTFESKSLTLQPKPLPNGAFSGSFFNGSLSGPAFTLGPVSGKISTAGSLSGQSTSYGPTNDGGQSNLTGDLKSDGQVSITFSANGKSVGYEGYWGLDAAGNLAMQVEKTGDPSDYCYITLSASGQPTPFAGAYTGSLVNSQGAGPYIPTFEISSNGLMEGVAEPLSDSTSGSYAGSLNTVGVGSLTFTSSAAGYSSYSSEAFTAFTPEGELVTYLTGGYVMTLARSYSGIHSITVGTGSNVATMEFAVSETGVVSGASHIGVIPCNLTGTVSSTGAVNITATSVNNTTFKTLQFTGALLAAPGGPIGSGAYNGPYHTWMSTGKLSSGLLYAGTYNLTSHTGNLGFTIDLSGSISGTGTGGEVVTGNVLADGTILIISTPASLSNDPTVTAFSGALLPTNATSVTGQGTFFQSDWNTGTWTLIGTRV